MATIKELWSASPRGVKAALRYFAEHPTSGSKAYLKGYLACAGHYAVVPLDVMEGWLDSLNLIQTSETVKQYLLTLE